MKTSVKVKMQTGLFTRTVFMLEVTADGLTFTPESEGIKKISIPGASIKSITFQEAFLKMEVEADSVTEVFFIYADEWLDMMRMFKKTLGKKVVCEMN